MSKTTRRKPSRRACPLCAERARRRSANRHTVRHPYIWSPETALAIFELIDKMRDVVLPSTAPISRTRHDNNEANPRQRTRGYPGRRTAILSGNAE